MRTNTNLAAEIIYKEETLREREREREDSVSFKNKNLNLHKAKKNKNDEFYTQLADIEKEVIKYKDHFKDKVIYCNCDDPVWSNFVRYFIMQFNFFGLKRLIATGYSVGDGSLTNQINFKDLFLPKRTYYFDIEKVSQELVNLVTKSAENSLSNDKLFEILKENNLIKELKEDGDFRSEECIDLLKQSDIVVTNPPFSLFREYVEQLFNYNKKFLIIGNKNAITYKEVFKHIKDNELWLGYGNVKMFINNKFEKQKFGNVGWFTNLEISKRDEPLILYKKYYNSEEDKNNPNYTNPAYPKYDNYDAIEVSKVVDIPVDYYGVMGVPITFLDKYTPKQFDIVKFRKGDDEKDLVYRKQEYLKEDIERERIQTLQNNSTLLQSTCSSSLGLIGMQKEIKCQEKECLLMEKNNMLEYLLNEFEIVALGIVGSCDFTCNKKMEILDKNGNGTGKYTFNAKGTLYKKYNPTFDKKPTFRNIETNELYSSIYARILITRLRKI